jgi:hypothetical protein
MDSLPKWVYRLKAGVPHSLPVMHFPSLAISHWFGWMAMQDAEPGMAAMHLARAMDLSEGHPGWEDWPRRSRKMVKKGRHHLSRWRNCLREFDKQKRKNERTKNEQEQKQANTKE